LFGHEVEKKIHDNLNNKNFKEINIRIQFFINSIFPSVKEDDIIGYYAKTDMIIEINNIKKGISIKSGSRNWTNK